MIRRSALFKIRHRRNAEEVALENTGRYLFPKGDFGSDLANAGLSEWVHLEILIYNYYIIHNLTELCVSIISLPLN